MAQCGQTSLPKVTMPFSRCCGRRAEGRDNSAGRVHAGGVWLLDINIRSPILLPGARGSALNRRCARWVPAEFGRSEMCDITPFPRPAKSATPFEFLDTTRRPALSWCRSGYTP